MSAHPVLDKRLVRLRFERAAPGYEAASALTRETGARMVERLDLVKLQPARILDAGSGTGALAGALTARYPKATVVELDLSLAMLRAGLQRANWGRRLLDAVLPVRRQPVCGDIEQMPLAPASVELVCSNLALPWVGRLEAALQEFHRVLARGGLLMFTTLGPDTLTELRAALGPAGAYAIHPFVDMHDIGDLLVSSGFSDPVMDMERLTLTYRDLAALLSELHASGGRTARPGRPPGLRGRAWRARLEERYGAFRAEGRLPLTCEIVYGHAWKPEQGARLAPDGRAVVRFERRTGGR
jgi:malonyl-CoA O-methyltransferase